MLTIPYAVKVVGIIVMPQKISIVRQLAIYQWAAVGIVAFALIHHFVKKNMTWLETFSHELTHIFVALLFFRRIHSFHAEEGSGVVYTSGEHEYGMAPMALAPYCLPIFTYLLLSIRCLMDFHGIWIYDILIGMTICFHFFCFKNQTGSYQTDIKNILCGSPICILVLPCSSISASSWWRSFLATTSTPPSGDMLRRYGIFSDATKKSEY